VRRWCRLLAHHAIEADPDDLALPRPARPWQLPDRAVVVHPGAAAPARRWPAERFARVVAHLGRRGHPVLLTGSTDERPLCEDVARRATHLGGQDVHVRAGTTTPAALAALVAHADLVVCNDTGVAHLASAFATPSVVLFGPTPPSTWGPPASGPHTALWTGTVGDPHGEHLDPALAALDVATVLAAVDARLAGVPA
jgi:ADP-heptose:LPS heptosyltransferase